MKHTPFIAMVILGVILTTWMTTLAISRDSAYFTVLAVINFAITVGNAYLLWRNW